MGPTSHTFASQTHQVLKEALQGHLQQDCLFQVALACLLELKRWARDVFLLDDEQLTTALTMTSLFNMPPGVIGQAWGHKALNLPVVSLWNIGRDSTQPATDRGRRCEPWPHSSFMSLRHATDPSILAWILETVKSTVQAGHRVVVLLEDSDDHSVLQNTSQYLRKIGGRMRARVPPGVLGREKSGDAWANQYWSVNEDGVISCPRSATPRTRTPSSRGSHLWCFDHSKLNQEVNDLQIRELAYILGGCGGEGNVKDDRAVWFSLTGAKSALNWQSQISCETFDFCQTWKIAGWQPSALEPMEVPLNAIPTGNPLILIAASAELRSLATRTQLEIPVPDGIVPAALQAFLLALGCSV